MAQVHPITLAPGPAEIVSVAEISVLAGFLFVGLAWVCAALWAVRS